MLSQTFATNTRTFGDSRTHSREVFAHIDIRNTFAEVHSRIRKHSRTFAHIRAAFAHIRGFVHIRAHSRTFAHIRAHSRSGPADSQEIREHSRTGLQRFAHIHNWIRRSAVRFAHIRSGFTGIYTLAYTWFTCAYLRMNLVTSAVVFVMWNMRGSLS